MQYSANAKNKQFIYVFLDWLILTVMPMYIGHCWILFEVLMLGFWGRVRNPTNIFPLNISAVFLIFRSLNVSNDCAHSISLHVGPKHRPLLLIRLVLYSRCHPCILDFTRWLFISQSVTACVSVEVFGVFITQMKKKKLLFGKKRWNEKDKSFTWFHWQRFCLIFHTQLFSALNRQTEILIG